MAFSLTACVAPGPQDLGNPEQIGPFFIHTEANPSIDEILELTPGDPVTFTVPFRSEDATEELFGVSRLDIDSQNRPLKTLGPFDPKGLEELRDLNFPWTVPADLLGCHSMSLLLTHRRNFDFGEDIPIDLSRAASAKWLMLITDLDQPGQRFTVDQCGDADQTPVTPSGGGGS